MPDLLKIARILLRINVAVVILLAAILLYGFSDEIIDFKNTATGLAIYLFVAAITEYLARGLRKHKKPFFYAGVLYFLAELPLAYELNKMNDMVADDGDFGFVAMYFAISGAVGLICMLSKITRDKFFEGIK